MKIVNFMGISTVIRFNLARKIACFNFNCLYSSFFCLGSLLCLEIIDLFLISCQIAAHLWIAVLFPSLPKYVGDWNSLFWLLLILTSSAIIIHTVIILNSNRRSRIVVLLFCSWLRVDRVKWIVLMVILLALFCLYETDILNFDSLDIASIPIICGVGRFRA